MPTDRGIIGIHRIQSSMALMATCPTNRGHGPATQDDVLKVCDDSVMATVEAQTRLAS